MATSPSAVYWVGADNNVYLKGPSGVQNLGSATNANYNLANGGFESNTLGQSVQAQRINDPNPPQQSSGSGGASGKAPADLSSFDQSIGATQSQINDLGPQFDNLLKGAYNKYQQTVNDLNQQKGTADRTYGQNKTTSAQDYSTAKNAIRTNTGSTISGIDTMLGARGGGGQAAGGYAALLAGKAGTAQLSGAGTNFAHNEQALDTNYHDFLNGYNTNLTNAGLQKEADVNSANADIQTRKANLLESLAGLINQRTGAAGGSGTAASQPYVNEARALLTSAAATGAPRPVAPITPLTYTPPALSTYTTNPTTVTSGGNGNAATESTTPFYTALLNRDKQLQLAA